MARGDNARALLGIALPESGNRVESFADWSIPSGLVQVPKSQLSRDIK